MKDYLGLIGAIFMICSAFGVVIAGAYYEVQVMRKLEDQLETCNCSVNYGGHNMSVEDAFERAGEGLTADQADEVKILIEEYCK